MMPLGVMLQNGWITLVKLLIAVIREYLFVSILCYDPNGTARFRKCEQ